MVDVGLLRRSPVSLAWMTKSQLAPFFIASLAGTAALVGLRGDWSTARQLGLLLGGSWGGYRLLVVAKELVLAGNTVPNPPASGMTEAIALVFVPSIRLETIQYMVAFGRIYDWLGLCGLGSVAFLPCARAAAVRTDRPHYAPVVGNQLAGVVCPALCGRDAICLPWPVRCRSIHCGSILRAHQRIRRRICARRPVGTRANRTRHQRWGKSRIDRRTPFRDGLGRRAGAVSFRAREDARDLNDVIAYLHAATPATALIETYDSELFLFLNRRYTYAPPQALVEVILREQKINQAVTYDPLLAKPNYMVVGEYGRWAGFYKPLNHAAPCKARASYRALTRSTNRSDSSSRSKRALPSPITFICCRSISDGRLDEPSNGSDDKFRLVELNKVAALVGEDLATVR